MDRGSWILLVILSDLSGFFSFEPLRTLRHTEVPGFDESLKSERFISFSLHHLRHLGSFYG